MTLFQIVMVVLMAIGFAVALGFGIAFAIEAIRGPKTAKKVKTQKIVEKEEVKEDADSIRKMLAQLEEETVADQAQEQPATVAMVNKAEIEEVISQEEPVLVDVVEVVEEVKEEPVVAPVVEESKEEAVVVAEPAVAPIIEEVKEEPVVSEEPVKEEPVAEDIVEVVKIEEVVEDDDDDDMDVDDIEEDEVEETPKTIVIEKVTTETIGTDFDYSVRLAKIVESKNKMERDLQKTKRAITKYERTQRRRTRNQKMLDRRAVELTNLNLMMYSVTDIKNVDADKKAKQEELTTHIAELKASIQDADLFLAKNKERYEHDKKMYAFYTKEEARYNDEIKELEILIKNANSVTGSTTTTTTTTTTETVE